MLDQINPALAQATDHAYRTTEAGPFVSDTIR